MNRITSALLALVATALSCSAPPAGGIPYRGAHFANVRLEFNT